MEFEQAVRSRRSIRVFTGTSIPDAVVHKCLELALLAPTSSNLQSWEFIRIVTPEIRAKMNDACLGQPAARTAGELIVCVARPDFWRRNRNRMLEHFQNLSDHGTPVPKQLFDYYGKLVPVIYTQGIFSILGYLRFFIFTMIGLFKPVPRSPRNNAQLREWAVKSSALACENLMLAFQAEGYATCPIEGFDEYRVKSLLKLPYRATVTMIVAAGVGKPEGQYGERIRFDSKFFIREV